MSRRRCLGGDRPTPEGGPVPQEMKRHTAMRDATPHSVYGKIGTVFVLHRRPLTLRADLQAPALLGSGQIRSASRDHFSTAKTQNPLTYAHGHHRSALPNKPLS